MINGSGACQLAEEKIIQATGQADAWRKRLESHGPNVSRDVFDNCEASVRYWTWVADSWRRELQVFHASTNKEYL